MAKTRQLSCCGCPLRHMRISWPLWQFSSLISSTRRSASSFASLQPLQHFSDVFAKFESSL